MCDKLLYFLMNFCINWRNKTW